MDELAVKTGISKRTIYMYFKSKDEIIETVIQHFMDEIGNEIDKILVSDMTPEEILKHMPEYFLRSSRNFLTPIVLNDLNQYYPHLWKKIEKFRAAKIQQILEKILNKSDNELMKNLDKQIVSTIFLASIQAVINPEYILKNNFTLDYAVNNFIEFFKYRLV